MSSCPSCGRDFPVRTRAMHACPHCGRPLTAEAASSGAQPPPAPPWLAESAPAAATRHDHVDEIDPLAGWDVAPPVAVTPSVSDGIVVASAAVLGSCLGALAARASGTGVVRGVVVGLVVGGGVAAAVRRIWAIDAPDATWAEQVSGGRSAPEQAVERMSSST